MRWAFLLLVAFQMAAAPVGNTAAPEIIHEGLITGPWNSMSLRGAYEGDFVTDGRMGQFNQGSGRIDNFQQDTNSGLITWNFVERLDLFGSFGMSRVKTDWRFELGEEVRRIVLKTEKDFLWATGARAILYEWRDVFWGCGGRYSASDYAIEQVSSNGASSPTAGSSMTWRQWQVNTDISCKLSIFTPYLGAKYSVERAYLNGFQTAIAGNGSGSNSFKNRDSVGFFLGCTLSNGKFFALNLEGRLVDEEAVTVTADLRF